MHPRVAEEMQAPVRHPSRQPQHQQQLTRQTGGVHGDLRGHPYPSTAIARGGRRGPAWPRPSMVRSGAVSRQAETSPAATVNASLPLKFTAAADAVRPHGNNHRQGQPRDGFPTAAGGNCCGSIFSGPYTMPIAESIARGVVPVRSPKDISRGQDRHIGADTWQMDLPRSYSQESLASQSSSYSTLSQASSYSAPGARQQQIRKPVKPPRPPGPPPPHIFEEQRKRRELMAQQKMQQQSAYASGKAGETDVGEGNIAGTRARSDAGQRGSPYHEARKDRSRPANLESPCYTRQQSSGSPGRRDRMEGCTTHLMQAGANILSNGDSSNLRACSGQYPGGTVQSSEAASPSLVRGRGHETTVGMRHSSSSSLPPVVRTSSDTGPINLALLGQGAHALSACSSSGWREYWDEEVEASYFYNSVTREARWVPPEEF